MDTLLFEYHTAQTRFKKLLTELSKYKGRLRAGEDVAAFENILANCEANFDQMIETAKKTESEFLEFKLRTLKELEGITLSDVAMVKCRWMESPFDVYSK
tara:strand:+ start:14716 stop:15015 length:300 start_codon:yes stop_codon:yes gene_type:complete